MNNFPFSLNQLLILQTIKNEKSFKNAAEKLYISQPAISRQVKLLEQNIALPIFERNKKQIYFTRTGELILEYATRIIVLCEEANRAIFSLNDVKQRQLIVGSSYTTGTYLLPKIIRLFSIRYRNSNIILEVNSTHRIAWGVANGQIDFGMIGGTIPNELYSLLNPIPFLEDELVLILPNNHKLTNLKQIGKEDLYDLEFIALKKSSLIRKVIDKILEKHRIESRRLKTTLELHSIEAIKSAVYAGLGVAFISIFALTDEIYLKNIHIAKIKNLRIKRILSIIINPKIYKSTLFEKFQNHIFELFQIK